MPTPTNAHRSPSNVAERARRARVTGRWPAWRWFATPGGVPGSSGWARELRHGAENGVFVVLIRDVETAWGVVRHAMIATPADGVEPTWAERQRIKNELLGRERVAVEVFPGMSELVDCGEPVFHLWTLPQGFALPFTLADRPAADTRQRDLAPMGGETACL